MSFNRNRAMNILNKIDSLSKIGDEKSLIEVEKTLINYAKSTSRHWRKAFIRLSKLVRGIYTGEIGEAIADGSRYRLPYSIFALNGNNKLPFVAFSTLPLYTCPGAGECAEWCYSLKSWRYPNAFGRQIQNTLLMRHLPNIIRDEFMRLKLNSTIRLYVDGDFESVDQILFWWQLLSNRLDISIDAAYGYSKSWDMLVRANELFQCPTNYKVNLSSGGKKQAASIDDMMKLPFVRGRFLAVSIDPVLMTKTRFALPEYHSAVRQAIKEQTGKAGYSCGGLCGECDIFGKPACASNKMNGITIGIGIH